MKIKIKPIEKPDKDWDKRATLMGGGVYTKQKIMQISRRNVWI